MSAKIISPFKLFDATSLGADIQSQPLDVSRLIYMSIAFDYTGAPTGSFRFQVRNGSSGWCDVNAYTVTLTGSPGSEIVTVDICPWQQVRLSYLFTSGTGTVTATVFAKGW